VPVSVTSQLKVVRLPVFDAAVNVNVAWIVCPAFRTVLCRALAYVSLLFFYDPYISNLINLGSAENVHFWLIATLVAIAFIAIIAIGAWIGYTMGTTPAPKPIEELTPQNETENQSNTAKLKNTTYFRFFIFYPNGNEDHLNATRRLN
jgi:hypothetical protein